MVRRLETRKTWFTEGARALRADLRARGRKDRLPSDEDWYACPLCLTTIFTIGILEEPDPMLTEEHVPPAWSGGTVLALTCKPCNSESGRLFDGEAHQQYTLRGFMAGESGEPVRAAFTIDGVTTYGDWHMTGTTGMCMFGVPQANNPASVTLPVLSMTDPQGDTARREIWIIQEPAERRCVMVVLGQHCVLLPVPDDTRSLEDLSLAWVGDHDLTQPARFSARGVLFPWPDKPLYSLDVLPADQAVAQFLGFGGGLVAVQEQHLGPGDQVDAEGELEPGGVDREDAGREPAEAGVLAGPDPVFGTGIPPSTRPTDHHHTRGHARVAALVAIPDRRLPIPARRARDLAGRRLDASPHLRALVTDVATRLSRDAAHDRPDESARLAGVL